MTLSSAGSIERHACGRHGRRVFNHDHGENGITPNATQSFTLTVDSGSGHHQRRQHDLHGGQPGQLHGNRQWLSDVDDLSETGTLPSGVT